MGTARFPYSELVTRWGLMLREHIAVRLCISLLALAVGVAHLLRPDLKIDSITIFLAVLAALPWLQTVIKTVEMLGEKLELQELKSQVADARGAAESASQQATLALVSSPTTDSLSKRSSEPLSFAAAQDELQHLAKEYEDIRASQGSGHSRTEAMTRVIRQMIDASSQIQDFDVRSALASPRPGLRLAGYAYLLARKDPRFLKDLVLNVAEREDTPFGQYWGLRAISRLLEATPLQDVRSDVLPTLARFAATLTRGTDRDYEVQKIIKDLKGGTA